MPDGILWIAGAVGAWLIVEVIKAVVMYTSPRESGIMEEIKKAHHELDRVGTKLDKQEDVIRELALAMKEATFSNEQIIKSLDRIIDRLIRQ